VEKARAKLRHAEEDRKLAEEERERARKLCSEAEASFAVVEAKKNSETLAINEGGIRSSSTTFQYVSVQALAFSKLGHPSRFPVLYAPLAHALSQPDFFQPIQVHVTPQLNLQMVAWSARQFP